MTERIPTHLDLLDIYTYGLCHKIYSGCDSLLKKKRKKEIENYSLRANTETEP